MRRESRTEPVVLLDVNVQALPILRSLGRRGVPIHGVVFDPPRPEFRSRYVRITRAAGRRPPELLACLDALADRIGGRPVLVPMQDDMVLFASRHRDMLARRFRMSLPGADIIEALVSKDGLVGLAAAAGVEQPGCWHPGTEAELRAALPEMRFPVLLKPSLSRTWNTPEMRAAIGGKVVAAADAEELLDRWPWLRGLGPDVVIQEEIAGEDSRLLYYVGYFDTDSRPVASFTGAKLRLLPAHYGSASVAVSRRDEEVIRISEAFMAAIGYRGHVGIEYKIDPRDGRPKLIEVNARFGLWDGLATRCGIDFPYIAYRALTGLPPVADSGFRPGVRWVSLERDLWAYLQYHAAGELGLGRWLRELLTGRHDWAFFAPDDPLPFLASTTALLRTLAGMAVRKVWPRPRGTGDAVA